MVGVKPIDSQDPTALPQHPLQRFSHGWRALRHRNFRLFFAGQSISLIGTWMTRVATSWLIYRLTGSGLGLIGFGLSQYLPLSLFLMLIVGFGMMQGMAASNTGHSDLGTG